MGGRKMGGGEIGGCSEVDEDPLGTRSAGEI